MKNILILILVVVAVGLVGYGFTQSNSNKNVEETHMEKTDEVMMEDDKTMEDDSMMEEDKMAKDDVMMEDDKMTEEDKMMVKGGEYVAYDPALLSRANSGKVVLFFHAGWCPTCKVLENDILKGQIPEDLTILKIDYDTASELKKKYGITIQHTLVQVDSNGNEITKWVGGNDIASIESKLK